MYSKGSFEKQIYFSKNCLLYSSEVRISYAEVQKSGNTAITHVSKLVQSFGTKGYCLSWRFSLNSQFSPEYGVNLFWQNFGLNWQGNEPNYEIKKFKAQIVQVYLH